MPMVISHLTVIRWRGVKLGDEVPARDANAWEVEAGGSGIQGQPLDSWRSAGLHVVCLLYTLIVKLIVHFYICMYRCVCVCV